MRSVASVGLLSLAFTGACRGSVSVGGEPEVTRENVESQVAAQLAAAVNQPAPTITCPSGLAAKVGASIDCELTVDGDPAKYPVHVVVDSVDKGTARFTAKVGPAPG